MGDIGKFCGLYTSGAAKLNIISSGEGPEPISFALDSGCDPGLPGVLLVGLYLGDGGSFICDNFAATGVPP
tara:strand:- start:765 stop:977 length:213 start_codon:yes stop_codon:yes gene_type:complete